MWNKIKSIEGNKIWNTIALKENNTLITNPEINPNTLARKFSENSSSNNYNKDFLEYKNTIENHPFTEPDSHITTNQVLNNPITSTELKTEFKKSKNTSPGPDQIHNIFLKKLPEDALKIFTIIFNLIWTKDLFSDIWKQATIIPILKPGKDKFSKDSYRPISLTCCPCQILEKIVNIRLRNHLENNNILCKYQSGFRKNCSTTDRLVSLESNINEAFANNQHVVAACMDMEKAYDLVWRRKVLDYLVKYKVSGHMLRFIQNFLNNRSIRVKINNALPDIVPIANGVPQGSVLSVTLFLIIINDIQDHIPLPVQYTIFADDITIYMKGKNINTTQTILQNTKQLIKIRK